MNKKLIPLERVEIICRQCGAKAMQHPRVKRLKGVCSETCRIARNRVWHEKNENIASNVPQSYIAVGLADAVEDKMGEE